MDQSASMASVVVHSGEVVLVLVLARGWAVAATEVLVLAVDHYYGQRRTSKILRREEEDPCAESWTLHRLKAGIWEC